MDEKEIEEKLKIAITVLKSKCTPKIIIINSPNRMYRMIF